MKNYNALLSTIECNFSAEIGADDESVRWFVRRLAENPAFKNDMRQQLQDSLADPAMSWKSALWSDYCHVFDATSEQQAREWLCSNLLPLVLG